MSWTSTKLRWTVAALGAFALLVPGTGSSSAQETRPHKATCVAIPEDPLSPNVRTTGSCQATHLGRETFTAAHTVVPTGPPDANGLLPVAVVGGRATHVSANGDELRSEYAGIGSVDLLSGRIVFALDGRYTGGTGRFEGASGATRITGVVEGGVAHFVERGSITY
jgi:hypothetical protein